MAEWKVKSVNGDPVEDKKTEEKNVEQAVEETKDAVKEEKAPEVKVSEVKDDGTIKVNLDAVQERETKEVPVDESSDDSEKVDDEVRESTSDEKVEEKQEEPIIELVEEDEVKEEEKKLPEVETKVETKEEEKVVETKQEYPEEIQKLIDFMDETGGSLSDYAKLNQNYDDLKPVDLMREYYKQTKPHLDNKEIDFLMDDKFGYNEDAEDREKRSKEILWKEELYNAKKYLNDTKDRYYADLKLNKQNELSPEQQEAIEFFNTHKKVKETNEQLKNTFLTETDKVFKELKGFDFKVGDKKYRYKVSDVEGTKKYQSDLNNFIGEFLGKDGSISDAAGYHKALFTAKNADKIAQHFYEQGKADGLKAHTEKSKNIDMSARADAGSVTTTDGTKFKVVSGKSASKFKLNLKNY